MGVKRGNDWDPSGDYGTEFIKELEIKKELTLTLITNLQKHRSKLEENSENTKILEDTIEIVDMMIRILEQANENLEMSTRRIKLYHG